MWPCGYQVFIPQSWGGTKSDLWDETYAINSVFFKLSLNLIYFSLASALGQMEVILPINICKIWLIHLPCLVLPPCKNKTKQNLIKLPNHISAKLRFLTGPKEITSFAFHGLLPFLWHHSCQHAVADLLCPAHLKTVQLKTWQMLWREIV